jgi:putative ABC transport system substrate-binding protein
MIDGFLRIILLIALSTAISHGFANADEISKVPRIGQLYGTNPSVAKPYDDALRDNLRSLGYVDGTSILLLPRYAYGDPKRFPALVSELLAAHVDVLIVAITALPAAMEATRTIPIIAPLMGDPVGDRLVASLAHPGGNLTGGAMLARDVEAKRLQLIQELVPGLKRVGLLFEATSPETLSGAANIRLLADRMGIALQMYGVHNTDEIRVAMARLEKDHVQALLVWGTPLMLVNRQTIMELTPQKLPVISDNREFAEAGAILTYAANYMELWGRSAIYVDKILKGAKPGDLPIEQPTKFTLRVNLKTAKQLHISIPESILLQADDVIR